mgnify:CR=1 FL=1
MWCQHSNRSNLHSRTTTTSLSTWTQSFKTKIKHQLLCRRIIKAKSKLKPIMMIIKVTLISKTWLQLSDQTWQYLICMPPNVDCQAQFLSRKIIRHSCTTRIRLKVWSSLCSLGLINYIRRPKISLWLALAVMGRQNLLRVSKISWQYPTLIESIAKKKTCSTRKLKKSLNSRSLVLRY